MDLSRLALTIYRGPTPQAAFAALVRVLGETIPLHSALDPGLRICEHPARTDVPDDPGTGALLLSRAETHAGTA
jgi:hypothetical protein